jgi:acetoin utilization protein AcuB
MRVSQIMSTQVVAIAPHKGIADALRLMQKHKIRHLPVMEKDRMVGWITSRDLREVMLASMLEKIIVADVMLKEPITVTPDTSVEDAARLLYEHKIGGLPVLEGDRLAGVLTMMDLIAAFLTMLGMLRSSSRLDVLLADTPEALDAATQIIKQAGGKIINVGLGPSQAGQRPCYFRLEKCALAPLAQTLKKQGYEVLETID